MTEPRTRSHGNSLLVTIGLVVIAGLLFWRFSELLSLENLKTQRQYLLVNFAEHPWATTLCFCAAYFLFSALALPGATILTLTGGAIFGVYWGSLLVLLSSSLGATVACAFSRFLFRGMVEQKFGNELRGWSQSFDRDGPLFLFTLRLLPFVPFALINLLMGLLPISFFTFFGVSFVGMIPATVIYVNAGTQLSELNSLRDVVSVQVLLSLILIGLFPWSAKKLVSLIKAKRI